MNLAKLEILENNEYQERIKTTVSLAKDYGDLSEFTGINFSYFELSFFTKLQKGVMLSSDGLPTLIVSMYHDVIKEYILVKSKKQFVYKHIVQIVGVKGNNFHRGIYIPNEKLIEGIKFTTF